LRREASTIGDEQLVSGHIMTVPLFMLGSEPDVTQYRLVVSATTAAGWCSPP
jgi:hypothetical protein